MPIFEFRCQDCQTKFQTLVGMVAGADEVVCPKCGGKRSDKLVSRFIRGRTEDDRVDEMADHLELMGEPESPTAMREMMKEMGKGMEEDLSDEMEQMFESDMLGLDDE
ncbi:MAG: zinc ribbon domain-containing protein [Fimbriimonadaceae bacterium]